MVLRTPHTAPSRLALYGFGFELLPALLLPQAALGGSPHGDWRAVRCAEMESMWPSRSPWIKWFLTPVYPRSFQSIDV